MRWFDPSALSGLALLVLSFGVVAALLFGLLARGPRRDAALSKVVVGAVGFQVFHFLEHGLQLGYWFVNPKEKPWLTPWAQTGVDGLAFWCQIWPGEGQAGQRGAELLHLVGNSIFFAGVIALFLLAKERNVRNRSVSTALIFQGFHFAEHTLLTVTVFLTGTGWGASTMFGRWSGSELSSHRVWWHFTVNGIATTVAIFALLAVTRQTSSRTPRSVSLVFRSDSTIKWAGSIGVGLLALQLVPFVVGSIAGDPAPRVRNLLLLDALSPGSWWHLADPYVLIPIVLLVAMWKVPTSQGLPSTE